MESQTLKNSQPTLASAGQSNPLWQEAVNRLNQGRRELKLGNYERAISDFDSARSIFAHVGDKFGNAISLNKLGIVYLRRNNLEQFEKYTLAGNESLMEAIDLMEETRSTSGVTWLQTDDISEWALENIPDGTLQLGLTLVEKGHWKRGLETLKLALTQFRELGDIDGKARTFLEMGAVQMMFGDYEDARLSFLDAERFFKKIGKQDGIALAQLKLGTLALEIYQYEEARKHLQAASEFFYQNHDQRQAEISDKLLKLADEYEQNLAPV